MQIEAGQLAAGPVMIGRLLEELNHGRVARDQLGPDGAVGACRDGEKD
jgi:hypothetical protein